MTRPGSRSRARLAAALLVLGATAAGASGCSSVTTAAGPPPRATATRDAAVQACTISPIPERVLGLPRADAETVRIAPDVVGEKVTWRSGSRVVIAWVGVDALDAFQDLDLVPVQLEGRKQSQAWTTRVRDDLFLVEDTTGGEPPCDLLYVSTEGLAHHLALRVVDDLRVGPPRTSTDAE